MPIVNYPEADSSEAQSTTEMFKDMLNQKRNLLFSKLTSFESDVNIQIVLIYIFVLLLHGDSNSSYLNTLLYVYLYVPLKYKIMCVSIMYLSLEHDSPNETNNLIAPMCVFLFYIECDLLN